MGNDDFIACNRRPKSEKDNSAPEPKCGPVWISECASCLNRTAPVNKGIDRWLVDTGCWYDLVSKRQAASVQK